MKLSETSLLSLNAPVHFHVCFYVRLPKTGSLCNRFVNMFIRMAITLPSSMKYFPYRWSRFIKYKEAQIPGVRGN